MLYVVSDCFFFFLALFPSNLSNIYNDELNFSHFRDTLPYSDYHGKEDYMAVTYKKLFHLLIDRGIPTAALTEKAGFSANILTRLRRDQYVSLDSIEKICFALDCKVDDILDFIPDEKEKENG